MPPINDIITKSIAAPGAFLKRVYITKKRPVKNNKAPISKGTIIISFVAL
jgi:hypothetical protein